MVQACHVLALLVSIFGTSVVQAQCPTGCKCNYEKYTIAFMQKTELRNIQCAGAKLKEMPDIPDQTGWLNLTDNEITAIKASTLKKLNSSTIFELYLDNNKISDIPSNTFKDLKNVAVISLKNNKISTIRTSAFAKISGYIKKETTGSPQAKLHLAGNPIASIEADAFTDAKNLNIYFGKQTKGKLTIKKNAFRKCDADEINFEGIKSLDVKGKSFLGAKVKKISLKLCTLSIENEGFCGVQYKRGDTSSTTCGSSNESGQLVLDSNELIDVPTNMVKDSDPFIITLKNNTLLHIKPHAFNGTKRLCRLKLIDNAFGTLEANSMSGIIKESKGKVYSSASYPMISIENNKFSSIDKNAFQGSKDVSQLIIKHSGVKHDLRIRSEAFNGLEVVLVRIKGFNFTLEKDAFKGLTVTTNALFIEDSNLPSICAYMFTGLKATAVTISNCKVNYVDEAVFKDAEISTAVRIEKGNDLVCSDKLYCKWKRMLNKITLMCKEESGREVDMTLYQEPEKCPKKENAPAGVCVPPKSETSSGDLLRSVPLTTALIGILGLLISLLS